MRILADENMPAVADLFGDLGAEIRTVPGRHMRATDVAEADVLLVRSVTRVNAALLSDASLQFVGSATIGTDHVDQALLSARAIPFAYAPGCNADAVGDYVIAALCQLVEAKSESLSGKTLTIIGAGNVGGRLAVRLRQMGLTVRVCDPPRQEQEGRRDGEHFCSLDEAMTSDIVCCHTPLVLDGPYPTQNMLSEALFEQLPQGAVFLNAGRGGILSADTLARVQTRRPDIRWVLDVWDPEPDIPLSVLPQVSLATGHIAGYSAEGRVRGTWMLRQALAQALDLPPGNESPVASLPDAPPVSIPAAFCGPDVNPWRTLAYAVRQVYDLAADDRRFRQAMQASEHGQAFDEYRRTYPQRRELMSTGVMADGDAVLTADQRALLAAAGFYLK